MSIWISEEEISHKPKKGSSEYEQLLKAGSRIRASQSSVLNPDTNVSVMAAAMVAIRRPLNIGWRTASEGALSRIEKEDDPGGLASTWAVTAGTFAIAADMLGYREPAFLSWAHNIAEVWTDDQGDTLLDLFFKDPGKDGALAFGSLCALYAYSGNTARLGEIRSYFVDGIEGRDPGYIWSNLTWQCDSANPRLINDDCVLNGFNIGGLIPEVEAPVGNGPGIPKANPDIGDWLAGAFMGAYVLDRMGTPIWDIENDALLRAISAHERTWHQLRMPESRSWVTAVADYAYGTDFYQEHGPTEHSGPNAGFISYAFTLNEIGIPYQITTSPQSTTVVLLEWQSDEESFHIEGRRSDSESWTISLTTSNHSLSIAGLAPSTEYVFRIRAEFDGEYSPFSEETSVSTDFSVPIIVTTNPLSDSSIQVSWQSTGPLNDVEWRPGSGAWESRTTKNESIVVSDLSPDTTYNFRVRTHDEIRFSGYSSEVLGTTKETPPITPPDNLRVVPLDIDGANLVWEYTGDGNVEFLIERNDGPGGWVEIGTSSTYGFVDTKLPGGVYNYRIRAFEEETDRYSIYSNSARVAIKKAPTGPPPRIIPLTASDVIPLEGPPSGEFVSVPFISTDLTSRFSSSSVYRDDNGRRHFETHVFRDFPLQDDDIFHTVRSGERGRLDLISYTYYNTVNLWWVIANANDIFHPLKDVTPGEVLRVPSTEKVYSEIMKYDR